MKRARARIVFPGFPTLKPDFHGLRSAGVRIAVYGMFNKQVSVAGIAGRFAHALLRRFEDVGLHSYSGLPFADADLAPHAALNFQAPIGIFFGYPHQLPGEFYKHGFRIGAFVVESDRVHPEWVGVCNRLDLVVVPSTFCREAFYRSGVTTPVMVVPHGLDPAFRPLADQPRSERFVFYNTFNSQFPWRKGADELVRCFLRAFAGRDDVRLRLRTAWTPDFSRYGAEALRVVELDHQQSLPAEALARLYGAAHCTVHPSKGEGFGLIPFESIACETPVIAPAITGMADYLNAGNAMVLKTRGKIRTERTHKQTGNYYQIDEDDLVDRLRYARDHWQAEADKLHALAPAFRERHSWDRALREFLTLIEQLTGATDLAAEKRRIADWFPQAEQRRFYEAAGQSARAFYAAAPAPDPTTEFNSLIYAGYDFPRDGIGNHLRLLDGLIFNDPAIAYKSVDEKPAPYWPGLYSTLTPYVHRQRPDLFRDALYFDIAPFAPSDEALDGQAWRVHQARKQLGAVTGVYLMWETSRLWEPLARLVQAHDFCIVTTDIQDVFFAQRGVDLVHLRHPYRFAGVERAKLERGVHDPLCFGVSAGLWARKNIALMAQVFAETFGADPRYRLKIHTRSDPKDPEFRDEFEKLQPYLDQDNIELLASPLSREQYLAWLDAVDAYCFISAGEGYSVTPREALHRGKPVILHDAHVHRGFSHLPGVLPVASAGEVPASFRFDTQDKDVGNEWRVDTASLRAALREMAENYTRHKAALVAGYDEILKLHDVDDIRREWIEVLNQRYRRYLKKPR